VNRLLVIGVLFLLVSSSSIIISGLDAEQSVQPLSSGKTLYVGGSGEGNYTKIQDAIDNASDGDRVFVYNGTYYENVVVDKSINLIGEDKYTTIIDGKGSGGVVYINSAYVNISGFTIRNGGYWPGYAGICIGTHHNNITDNIISNNWEGIGVFGEHNTISFNNILKNYNGTWAMSSSKNTITRNNICLNRVGIIFCLDCHKNIIKSNNISSNNGGISFLWDCYNNIIKSNNISSNNGGIGMSGSRNNSIIGNNVSSNYYNGISIGYYSFNNIVNNNTVTSNSNGIRIQTYADSPNNIIYHNNFINNTKNAYDEDNNTWDDGEYGNYWSDYRAKYPFARKLRKKGIWDTPYEISEDNKDNFPLIKRWPEPVSKISPNSENVRFQRWVDRFPLLNQLIIRIMERWSI
jgi:parallel beta-helix repeat protein